MKAIIVGASSGIGRALTKEMSAQGWQVGITARRVELLESLQEELVTECKICQFDLVDVAQSVQAFGELLDQMGAVDVIVINSGVGSIDTRFPLADELSTIAVNVTGFTAIANLAYHHFEKAKAGHIVGISSVAAVRGGPIASYNASKAYVSSYLEGLAVRSYSNQDNISISDIRPGFVDTAMAKGEGIFWMASVEKAAQQILSAINSKRRVAYITRRWKVVAMLIRVLPFGLYKRIMS